MNVTFEQKITWDSFILQLKLLKIKNLTALVIICWLLDFLY